jgi:predicted NBD/HSP70 family sugar kinase
MADIKTGKNLGDLQAMNRALVLQTLRGKMCSRSDIAKSTGLQQATITNIINDMIESGIVKETGLIKGLRGRRSIGLIINSEQYRVIGMRLTRKFVLAGLYDIAGTEYQLEKSPIDVKEGVQGAILRMHSTIQTLIERAGGREVLGIGIGLPGPFLKQDGKIAVMAEFPGWEGVSLQEDLENAFHIPVYQEHDAYASALAEWWFGGHRQDARFLLSVSMEQGLGAGLIAEGKLYYGSQGVAGEIGHLSIDYDGLPCTCGNRGCLRNYCTTRALLALIKSQLPQHPDSLLAQSDPDALDLPQIIQAVKAGDAFAQERLRQAARYLGYGIVNTIYAYNPDLIILSEEFSAAGSFYLDAVYEAVQERVLPDLRKNLRIVFSQIKGDSVLMGTVALVIDWLFQNPSTIFH